jgi:hypothetical protein
MYDAVPSVIPGSVNASMVCIESVSTTSSLTEQLGEAEVHHLHVTALGHENIRGLDVAMHDALRVRRVEGVGDLDADIDNLGNLEHAAAEAIVERVSLHPLHDDERLALMFTDVVNRADVGVVQPGRRSGLDPKPFNGLPIAGEVFGNELEGDLSSKPGVVGPIDDAHAAGAELIDDPIVRNGFTDHACV